jgi:hypothetical protein
VCCLDDVTGDLVCLYGAVLAALLEEPMDFTHSQILQ